MSDNIDIVIRDRIQDSIRRKIEQIGTQADRTHSQIERLKRNLQFGGRAGNVGGAANQFNRLAQAQNRATASTNRFRASMSGVGGALSRVRGQLLSANGAAARFERGLFKTSQTVRSLLSGILLLGATGGLASQIDGFRTLQNQVRQTADSQEQLTTITNELFDIAQRSRSPLDGLGKIFRRIDDSARRMGRGQEEALRATETLLKVLSTGGLSGAETQSVVTQLTQGLNSAQLMGEEFRALSENSPRFMQALADAAGVSRLELRKLRTEGKLTSDLIFDALFRLGDDVDNVLSETPRTAGQGLQQLFNRLSFEFSRFADQSGLLDGINRAFDRLGQNLPTVTRAVVAFGAAFAFLSAGAIIPFLASFGSIPVLLAAVVGYFTFFSNEIKTSNSEVITLTDSLKALVNQYARMLELTTGDIFTPQGAQEAYDAIAATIATIKDSLFVVLAGSGAVIQTIMDNVSPQLIAEPFIMAAKLIANAFTEVSKQITLFMVEGFNAGVRAIQGSLNQIIRPLEFAENRGLLGNVLPFVSEGQMRQALDSARAFRDIFGEIDTSAFSDAFDNLKFQIEDFPPAWDKAFSDVEKNYENFIDSLRAFDKAAEADRNREAMENAIAREKEEMRLRELRESDPSSLRGADGQQALQFQRELGSLTEQAGVKAQRSASFVADSYRDAMALAQGLNSINQQGFQQLQELQNSRIEGQIQQAVGNNPDAARQDGIFTEGFIQRAEQAVQTQGSYNAALQQTVTSSNQLAQSQQAVNAATSSQSNTGIGSQEGAVNLQNSANAFQNIATQAQAAQPAVTSVGTSFGTASQQSNQFQNSATQSFQQVGQAANTTGNTIQSSISRGASSAASAVSNLRNSAVADFRAIESAANSAAAAASSVGSGGGGFFGRLFKKGGYTGDIGTNQIAGAVHGQEFVMPAGPTKKYRSMLEAMRAGRRIPTVPDSQPSSTSPVVGAGSVNVTVQNYTAANVSVDSRDPNNIRLIVREEMAKQNDSQTAALMLNANSKTSRALRSTTNVESRR